MKAAGTSPGMSPSKARQASSPPAEAPMAMTGKWVIEVPLSTGCSHMDMRAQKAAWTRKPPGATKLRGCLRDTPPKPRRVFSIPSTVHFSAVFLAVFHLRFSCANPRVQSRLCLRNMSRFRFYRPPPCPRNVRVRNRSSITVKWCEVLIMRLLSSLPAQRPKSALRTRLNE